MPWQNLITKPRESKTQQIKLYIQFEWFENSHNQASNPEVKNLGVTKHNRLWSWTIIIGQSRDHLGDTVWSQSEELEAEENRKSIALRITQR